MTAAVLKKSKTYHRQEGRSDISRFAEAELSCLVDREMLHSSSVLPMTLDADTPRHHIAESGRIHFPLPRTIDVNRVELVLYSPSMTEVHRWQEVPVLLDDTIGAYVAVDVADGVDLASGVYYYIW